MSDSMDPTLTNMKLTYDEAKRKRRLNEKQ